MRSPQVSPLAPGEELPRAPSLPPSLPLPPTLPPSLPPSLSLSPSLPPPCIWTSMACTFPCCLATPLSRGTTASTWP